ncbi:MAG: aldo/keto reductase [Thermodesulfobacteriota bacterium]
MADRGITRRQFMAAGAAGAVGLGLGGLSTPRAGAASPAGAEILYRTLGRTGLRIPVVSFGVMNTDSPDLIRKALDVGIKHLDTAHGYMRGNSETVIGQVLEERKARDKIYLATKMYFDRDKDRKNFVTEGGRRGSPATEARFEEQLALSLKRLRTAHVEILYLHSCESAAMASYEPMMKIFTKAKASGRARFIGITTHVNEPEVIRAAADAGVWDVILTSYNFMQEHKDRVKAAIQYAAAKGVGIVAMKTQGGVKPNRDDPAQVNHAAALKWVLNDKNVCTAIPGITAFDQMELDMGVMKNLALSRGEEQDLRTFAAQAGPLYCQQCGSCVASCIRRVEIPTLMRSYMYAEGYHNLIQAELTLREIAGGRGLTRCAGCDSCTAVCRSGIPIPDRIRSLIAMYPEETRLA